MMAGHARSRGSWQSRVIAGTLFSLLVAATSASAQNTFPPSGFVGVGTDNPSAPLHVWTNSAGAAAVFSNAGSGPAFLVGSAGAQVDGSLRLATDTPARVGIGTLNPTAKLHVAGDVVVDGNIAAKYQDVAEWVPARAAFPQGTVVVIDGNDGKSVLLSSKPYDPRVAGVVSSRPGILLGEAGEKKVKVAHSGRVKVKADAHYGSIAVGDLLVASATPGYAMRSVPVDLGGTPIHRPGTLLGKALEGLEKGQGEILILLILQ